MSAEQEKSERGYYQEMTTNGKKRKLEEGEIENEPFDGASEAKVIERLLGPFTRDQIVSILVSAALQHSNIYNEIKAIASVDVAHRKLFVRGLSWDTTTASLESFFEKFGTIEECTVIMDRNTGKSKGFGFVTFQDMESADKVLQIHPLEIDGRKCTCNLAAKPDAGSSSKVSKQSHPAPSSGQQPPVHKQQPQATPAVPHYPDAGPPGDENDRKLFVRGLDYNTHTDTVTGEFKKYGELEEVAIAKDRASGKSKGFAFIVFKHQAAAKRALMQPQKVIDGRTTHCNLASQNRSQAPAAAFPRPNAVPPMVPMPAMPHHGYVQAPYMGYAQPPYTTEMYHMLPPQYAPMPPPPTPGYYHPPPPSNPPQ